MTYFGDPLCKKYIFFLSHVAFNLTMEWTPRDINNRENTFVYHHPLSRLQRSKCHPIRLVYLSENISCYTYKYISMNTLNKIKTCIKILPQPRVHGQGFDYTTQTCYN
jgi:hypothetical protein